MATVVRLNQPEINLAPYSPLRSAAASVMPIRRAKPRFFVAVGGGDVIGFAHFEPAALDQRWQLEALGANSSFDEAAPAWEELATEATVAAGERGVKRLYARLPKDWFPATALRAVGFAPYATETVFLARQQRAGQTHSVLDIRQQEQSDTWAIHQLYNASVPRQVQYAEAYTSHRWDVQSRVGGQIEAAGWLVEDGHLVIGYARVLTRGESHVLEVLYHPDRIDVIGSLIDSVLVRLLRKGTARLVYCAVRGYQAEAGSMLEQRGFVPILDQELHLKYTTANVRVPATETVVFHTEVTEKLPKRVPSFLHGRPQDESAT